MKWHKACLIFIAYVTLILALAFHLTSCAIISRRDCHQGGTWCPKSTNNILTAGPTFVPIPGRYETLQRKNISPLFKTGVSFPARFLGAGPIKGFPLSILPSQTVSLPKISNYASAFGLVPSYLRFGWGMAKKGYSLPVQLYLWDRETT